MKTPITDAIIILEVPHRFPPKAWIAWSKEEIIDRLERGMEGRDCSYQTYTHAEWLDTFGTDEFFWTDTVREGVAMFDAGAPQIVEVYSGGISTLYTPEEAPSYQGWLWEIAMWDNSWAKGITYDDYMAGVSYPQHQDIKAKCEVDELAERLGWIATVASVGE